MNGSEREEMSKVLAGYQKQRDLIKLAFKIVRDKTDYVGVYHDLLAEIGRLDKVIDGLNVALNTP